MVSATQAQQDTHFLVIACVSIFIFDYLQTFPDEIKLYWNRGWGAFKSPIVLIFIAVRYFTVMNAIFSIYTNANPETPFHVCVATVRVPIVCMIIVNYATNCLFTLRVYALSNRNKWLAIGLLCLAAFQIPPGIAYEFGLQSVHLPGGDGCSFKTNDRFAIPIFYGMGLLFDTTAFGFTAFYLLNGFQRLGFWTPVAKALLQDGLAYVLIAGAVQLANIIFYVGVSKTSHLRGITGPLVFITAVLAQRVTLHHLTDFQMRGVVRSKFNESSAPGSGMQSRQGLRSYKSSQGGGYGSSTQQTEVSFSSPPPTAGYAPSQQGYAGQQQQQQAYPGQHQYRSREKDMYELA